MGGFLDKTGLVVPQITTEEIILENKSLKDLIPLDGQDVDYVIETYNDGENWYRLYKSGWIEQGGSYPSSNVSSSIVLTLPTPFTTTNYIVMITGDGNVNAYAPLYNTKTTTSFSIFGHGGGGGAGNWYACGI